VLKRQLLDLLWVSERCVVSSPAPAACSAVPPRRRSTALMQSSGREGACQRRRSACRQTSSCARPRDVIGTTRHTLPPSVNSQSPSWRMHK
jgi:hypothetical protein